MLVKKIKHRNINGARQKPIGLSYNVYCILKKKNPARLLVS